MDSLRALRFLAIALAVMLSCSRAPGQAPAAKSGSASARSVEAGKRAFSSAGCFACHGSQGQGTPLAPQIAPPPFDLPALISYVRRPTGKMPPVTASTASDQQLGDIFAFLTSVAPAPSTAESAPGNAENGKKLFESYGCYQCHGHQGAGAATAPRIAATALTLAAVMRYVRAPTGQMPPYTSKVVSDQDLADIYAYLKTFPLPKPAADILLLNQ